MKGVTKKKKMSSNKDNSLVKGRLRLWTRDTSLLNRGGSWT